MLLDCTLILPAVSIQVNFDQTEACEDRTETWGVPRTIESAPSVVSVGKHYYYQWRVCIAG